MMAALEANCRAKRALKVGVFQEETLRSVRLVAKGEEVEQAACDHCVMCGIPCQVSIFFFF